MVVQMEQKIIIDGYTNKFSVLYEWQSTFISNIQNNREQFLISVIDRHKVYGTVPTDKVMQIICEGGKYYGVKVFWRTYWMNNISLIQKNIKLLSELQPNWGSYGEDEISIKAIDKALFLLVDLGFVAQNVFVSPMRDGGIQFEFSNFKNEAEVEISTEGVTTMIFYDKKYNGIRIKYNFKKLHNFLNKKYKP